MKLKQILLFAILTTAIFFGCNKIENGEEELKLTENGFIFSPTTPGTKDEIKIITYECGYNEFGSLKIEGYAIELKKRFNGQMKRPCILEYDTISLGRLDKGTYEVTFILIDINPMVIDSVSVQKKETLVVGN